MNKPKMTETETLTAYLDRVDAWKAEGAWTPASGGTETPVVTLLYCYQARTGKHAYLDCGTDMILTDAEARNLLAV